MNIAVRGRRAIRRAVIASTAGFETLSGRAQRLWEQNHGIAVLLLHNTLTPGATSLVGYVQENRDHFVDFGAVEAMATGTTSVQSSTIALTFDDGFRSNLAMARQLSELNLQACFYVPTDVIGADQEEVDRFYGRPQVEGVMTWSDLDELVALGHLVGSHCRQHKPLIDQSDAEAEDQVKGSLAVLRHRLGGARHFAWPFGSLRHADTAKVAAWCNEVDAIAASGIRGFNTAERYSSQGYLRRDPVNLRWLRSDVTAFLARDARRP